MHIVYVLWLYFIKMVSIVMSWIALIELHCKCFAVNYFFQSINIMPQTLFTVIHFWTLNIPIILAFIDI